MDARVNGWVFGGILRIAIRRSESVSYIRVDTHHHSDICVVIDVVAPVGAVADYFDLTAGPSED